MRYIDTLDQGNLVLKYQIGNTKIMVYDSAYAGKTQEEIDQVLARLNKTASKALYSEMARRQSLQREV